MDIKYININEIKPYEKNSKKHPKDQIEKIKKSIQAFGFNVPLILDKNNFIISEHGRFLAAKELEMTELPVIYKEDLTEEQVRAYRIADNKVAESEWDFTFLKDEYNFLTEKGFDWNLTGFDVKDFKKEETEEDDFVAVDAYERTKKNSKIQNGDIFQLGDHRLMCGDSVKEEDVSKLMNGEKADMCFTDPPYGVNYSSKNKFLNSIDKGNKCQEPILNDNIEDYNIFFNSFLKNMKLNEDASYYITISGQKLLYLLEELNKINMPQRQILVWVKNNHVLGRQTYANKHELIVFGWNKKHNYYGNFDVTVWDIKRPVKSELHPTMKPLELIERALKNSSKEKDIIIDLFGGSGSTLIACQQLNRRCYMMEIDPVYCQVIIDRWEKYTGLKAEKI